MASLFGIPLKKSYDVDLTKPLKNMISSFYSSSDEPLDLNDAIEHLNKSRMNCVSRTLDPKHESSLELLEKYYDQISSLESKCPPELHVQFKWKDALDKGGSFLLSSNTLALSSLSYEKVCVLFNIGAVQSQIGAYHGNDGLSNDAALKLSAKYFQGASGIFQALKHIASSAVGGQDLTVDLTPEVLNILHVIMLAQAQETFYYKAANDNMKDHIIAKVANHCEQLYADAQKQLQVIRVGGQDKEWMTIVNMKQSAFLGIANYYQSLVCQQQKDFGEQITRLQKAVECLKTAESKGGAYFTPHFRERLSLAVRGLEEAKKDNDFIYHAKVPDYRSVKSIGTAALSKPTNLPEKFRPNAPDLFERLLPMSVQQAVTRLDVRKQDLVNSEISALREQSEMLDGILASLNLPASIEDTGGEKLPPSLIEKADAIRVRGGMALLEKYIRELPELFQRNKEILEETERQILLEEESDDNLRDQFKDKWKRTPSAQLNACWKEHISKYNSIIQNAVQADNKVKEKFHSHEEKMRLLSSSMDALINAIPSGGGADSNLMSSQCVVRLRQLMDEVNALKAQRQSLEDELKSATFSDMKNKFMKALSDDGAINEDALTVEAIGEAFGPLQKRIRENKEKQERLIREIRERNDEYVMNKRSSNSNNSSREAYFSELAAAYDAYIQLSSNLQEGSKFYNDLTVLLANLQSKVGDFCFARKAEREDLCKHLQNEIVSQPTPRPPAAPSYHESDANKPQRPPRPPPPQTAQAAASQPTQNLPFSNPYAPNPHQQYYHPPPPLPTGYNPYPFAQTQTYPQQSYPQQGYQQQHGYQQPQGYPQQGYPQPNAGGYVPQQGTVYPPYSQQPYGYYPQQQQ